MPSFFLGEPKLLLLRIKNLESIVIMLVDLLKTHSVPIPDNVQIIKVASKTNEINPCADVNIVAKNTFLNMPCSSDSQLVLSNAKISTISNVLNSIPADKIIVDQNSIEHPVEKDIFTDDGVPSVVNGNVNMTSTVTCSECNVASNTFIDKKQADLPVLLNSSAVKDIQHVAKLPVTSTQLLQVSTMNRTYSIVSENVMIPSQPNVNSSLQLQDKNITKLENYVSVPFVYIPATTLPALKVNGGICQNVSSGKMEIKNSLWRPISSLIPPVCTSVKQVNSDISNIHLNMSLDKVVEPYINKDKQVLLPGCGKTIPSANLPVSNDVMDQKTDLVVEVDSSDKISPNKVLIVESDFSLSVNNLPISSVILTITSSSLTATIASSSLMATITSASSSVMSTLTSSTVTSTSTSPLVLSTIPCSITSTSPMDLTCISNITTCSSDNMKCSSVNLAVLSNQNDSIICLDKSPTKILSELIESEGSNRNQSKCQDTDGIYRNQSKFLNIEKPQDVSGLNKSPVKNINKFVDIALHKSPLKSLDMKPLDNSGFNSKSSKTTSNTASTNKNPSNVASSNKNSNTGSSNKNHNVNLSSNKNQCIVSSTNDIPLQTFGIDNLLVINNGTASLNPVKSNKHSLPTDCCTHVDSVDITEKSASNCKYKSTNNKSNKDTFSPIKKGVANSVISRSRLSSTGHTVASLLETTNSLSEFEVQIKRNVNPHYVNKWNDISSSNLTSNFGDLSCTFSKTSSSNKNTCNITLNKNLNITSSNNSTCVVSSNKNTCVVTSTNKTLSNIKSTNKSQNLATSNKINKNTCTLTSTYESPYSYLTSTSRITANSIVSISRSSCSMVSPKKSSNSFSCNKNPFPNTTSSNGSSSANNGSSESTEKTYTVSSCENVTSIITQPSKSIKQVISTATPIQSINASCDDNVVNQVTSTVSSANYSTKRWGNVLENAHNSNMLLSCFTLGNKKRQRNKNKNKYLKKTQPNGTSVVSINSPEQNFTSVNLKTNNLNSLKSNQINPVSGMNSQCSDIQNSISSIITNSPPAYSEAIALNTYSIPQSASESSSKNSCIIACTNEIPYSYITSTNRSPQSFDASTTDCNWIIRSSVSLAQKPIINNSVPVPNSAEEILNKTNLPNASNDNINSSSLISITSVESSYTTPLRIKSGSLRTMKDRTIRNKWLEMEQGKNNTTNSQNPSCTTNSQQVDQCASPVISFPNQGNRKRNVSGVSNERVAKRLAQCSIDIDENSSRIFSAESLCQSANQKDDEMKSFKTNVKTNKMLDMQKHMHNTTQQKLEHPVQKLKHQPDIPYSNSLPTILNIFAPAPVPSSTSNQSNLNTGISNFSAESLVSNECNVNMIGNNMGDSTFQDTMLMGANSQLFTNFSADTLLSDNESAAAYTEENIIAQNNVHQISQYWNNPWLSQEIPLNETVFPNPSNMQNNLQRQQRNNLQASTECSPIKSIMSILQSTPTNNQNLNFDNFNDNTMNNVMLPHAIINRIPHRNRRLDNQINTHTNIIVNTSQWNKNHTNNISQTGNKVFSSEPMMPLWNNHMANNHRPNNRDQIQINAMNVSNVNTRMSYNNTATKTDVRNKKENGPMFGNYPLVSSGAT